MFIIVLISIREGVEPVEGLPRYSAEGYGFGVQDSQGGFEWLESVTSGAEN
jgi:hypothetical protein